MLTTSRAFPVAVGASFFFAASGGGVQCGTASAVMMLSALPSVVLITTGTPTTVEAALRSVEIPPPLGHRLLRDDRRRGPAPTPPRFGDAAVLASAAKPS